MVVSNMSNIAIDDSKIPWLGVIPKTWSLTTISAFYELRNEKVSDKDYPPLSVTMNGIVPRLDSAAKKQTMAITENLYEKVILQSIVAQIDVVLVEFPNMMALFR